MEDELTNTINQKFIVPLNKINNDILSNKVKIFSCLEVDVLGADNKEKLLLNFRRCLEMVIQMPLFITTTSLTTNKIIVVRKDNLSQLLDDRYYSNFQLSSFLDIFKIETNDYKSLNLIGGNIPHIKLVINYIIGHYNTTFRKFMNRNIQYYYMYKFFFDNGEKIKGILDLLNSYHYSLENEHIYQTLNFEAIYDDILNMREKIVELLDKKI